ncbi:hypothetical protein K1719_023482 [Acacia pycnantha]|nr:hypothetical protein K1719_023482 [Acacia pycnantha]
MEPGFTPPVDGNDYKEYLKTLSIPELISNLRTAFHPVHFDRVVEVLAENETKLKYEMKALTEKLELETLVRMSAEEECKGRKNAERYVILLESVKKNNEVDHENTLSELRIKNAKLEEERRLAESEAEFWKNKFEELSERLLLVEKGVNSFVNGDAHVGIGGKAEDLSSIRGSTHPGVSDEVMDEKDMNVNDICDNKQGNTTAGSSPSPREDLKSGNTHVSTDEISRQSPNSPNKALLGASVKFSIHLLLLF